MIFQNYTFMWFISIILRWCIQNITAYRQDNKCKVKPLPFIICFCFLKYNMHTQYKWKLYQINIQKGIEWCNLNLKK